MTRRDIVEAAAQAFRRYGYRGATLGHIADAVGIQKASLYHHIDSKESLLVEILESGIRPTLHYLQRMVDDPHLDPCEKLEKAVYRHVIDTTVTIDSQAVFMKDFDALSDETERQKYLTERREYEEMLQRLVEPCLHAHGKELDARLTVLALLGMCNSLPNWYRDSGRLRPDDIAGEFAQLARGMVGCD